MYMNMYAYANQLLVYQIYTFKEDEGIERKPFLFVMLFESSERTTKKKTYEKKSIIEHKAE